ncbi:MAG: hypothetical protein OEY85_07980 [Rhodospirillales bacterium]|nr:hypothetical protein [Rhodospirillales bacterium]
MNTGKIITTVGIALATALLLGGCRAGEQGRTWDFKPGVYKGKPDTQLSQAQTKSLRDRAGFQSDVSSLPGGGGSKPEKDVRPPDDGALKSRADNQRDK